MGSKLCKHCGQLFRKETDYQRVCPSCKEKIMDEANTKRRNSSWVLYVSKMAELRRMEDVREDSWNHRAVQKPEKKIEV